MFDNLKSVALQEAATVGRLEGKADIVIPIATGNAIALGFVFSGHFLFNAGGEMNPHFSAKDSCKRLLHCAYHGVCSFWNPRSIGERTRKYYVCDRPGQHQRDLY